MKTLIENCFTITTKKFNKDVKKARDKRSNVEGVIQIKHRNTTTTVAYTIEYGMEFDYLVIHNAGIEQRIKLIDGQLKFGTRIYFICDCGARLAKLYLPEGLTDFKCRHCHNLAFQSSGINKHSKHGALFYTQSLMLKIMNARESMWRIFYRSKYTKRFNRWLDLCDKVGLTQERANAEDLLKTINGFR